MALELYFMIQSPPSRVAYMVLKALNLKFDIKIVDIMKGQQKTPEFLAINPRGKVPTLKDGDYVIAESRAIATYLCNQYEKGNDSTRLYPVDPKARGTVDQILYVSECMNDMLLSYVNLPGVIFRGESTNVDKVDEVHKALQFYETYLKNQDYVAGSHLTLADFFMLSPLLLLGCTDFNDYTNYPKMTSWLKKMKSLPYYEESHKEGMEWLNTKYREAVAKQQ